MSGSLSRSRVDDLMRILHGEKPPTEIVGTVFQLDTAINFARDFIWRCRYVHRMEGCINEDAKT